jgi:hypothetical protein
MNKRSPAFVAQVVVGLYDTPLAFALNRRHASHGSSSPVISNEWLREQGGEAASPPDFEYHSARRTGS